MQEKVSDSFISLFKVCILECLKGCNTHSFSAMVAGKNITSVSEQNGYILLHASLSNKHKINTAVVLDSVLLRNDPIIC